MTGAEFPGGADDTEAKMGEPARGGGVAPAPKECGPSREAPPRPPPRLLLAKGAPKQASKQSRAPATRERRPPVRRARTPFPLTVSNCPLSSSRCSSVSSRDCRVPAMISVVRMRKGILRLTSGGTRLPYNAEAHARTHSQANDGGESHRSTATVAAATSDRGAASRT